MRLRSFNTIKNKKVCQNYLDTVYITAPENWQPYLFTREGKCWINIPCLFTPSAIFTITSAGYNLNFHDSPSVTSAVLRKLQPSDTVTILEGPVEEDGYSWWKMKTDDGLEGREAEVSVWYEPVSTATPTPTK